jgi:hypothetical protein
MKPKTRIPSALRAEAGGTIIADRAKISGYDQAAVSNTGGRISLNDASVNQNPDNPTDNAPKHYWYQRPMGIIALMVVAGLIVAGVSAWIGG